MFSKMLPPADPYAIDGPSGQTMTWDEYHQAMLERRVAENEQAAKQQTTDLKKWAIEQAVKAGVAGCDITVLAARLEAYVTGATEYTGPSEIKIDFPSADEMGERLAAMIQAHAARNGS